MSIVRRRLLGSGSHRIWAVFHEGQRKPAAVLVRGGSRYGGGISRRLLGAIDASKLSPAAERDEDLAAEDQNLVRGDTEYDELVDELVEIVAQFPLVRPTEGFDTLAEPIRRLNRLVGEFVSIGDEVKQRWNEALTRIPEHIFSNEELRQSTFAGSAEDDVRLAIAIQGLQEFVDGGEISSTVNRLLAQFGYEQLSRSKVFDLVRRAERLLATESGRDRLSAIPTVSDQTNLLVLEAMIAHRRRWLRAVEKVLGIEIDYYAVLGVAQNASAKDITEAYRKLALQYHSSANPNDAAAEARFKAISAAYDVLGYESRRREYDEKRLLG